ncbi:MAG: hypothetical protein ACKVRN_06430 [Pyrinomonadaceae bacterium]
MHCPNCGQQQVSNETKFCSRCGMPLGLVSEVMANGGFLPQLAELEKGSNTLLTRKNGLVFSLFWMIFFLLILAVIFGGILGIDLAGEIFSVIGIFGGLLIAIFSLGFLKKTPKYLGAGIPSQQHVPASLYGQPVNALPPQQSVPASVYQAPATGSWRDTNDLEPASVTENTTKLLEKEETPQ